MKDIFTAFLTAIFPILISFLVTAFLTIAGILIPKFVGWVKYKVGAAKFVYALTVAQKVYTIIITYFDTNPAATKTLEALETMFEGYMKKFLKLSPEELQFLFNGILGDLIKALGLNSTEYAVSFAEYPRLKAIRLFK